MTKKITLFLLFLLIVTLVTSPLLAQDDETLTIRLNRDFGYASGTGNIQGRFSIRISGSDTIEEVTFYLDETVLGTDSEEPFRLQFQTDNYPAGKHTLYATATTTDGQTLQSPNIARVFVTPEATRESVGKLIIPILGGTIALIGIIVVVTVLIERRRGPIPLGASRSYGMMGGTVCQACQRPFSIHFWSFNFITRRYDRCPHCGKWQWVSRFLPQDLKTAEQAELKTAPATVAELTPEEKLRRQLDDSRFEDI